MPHKATYRGHEVEVRPQEKLLDALLRVGAPVPFSCRGGVCHACMLRCAQGVIPAAAQRGLAPHLRARDYLLACQCLPESNLTLEPRRGVDMQTQCLLLGVEGLGTSFVRLEFEAATTLDYRPGQRLQVVAPGMTEPFLLLTSDPTHSAHLSGVIHCPGGTPQLPWLQEAIFGTEFEVRGPLDGEEARAPGGKEGAERPDPHPDPALWNELGDGSVVRAVLEDFYAQVYVDPSLAPYFVGVTKARAAEKQYAFLRRMMTGERIDFVGSPRDVHHWMVIPPALFDHRQALMIATLKAHGVDATRIARWTRFEEHYRADIVKSEPWPKRVGDQLVDLEAFSFEVLSEATLCDYCQAEIPAGTRVRYHLRLGHVSCPACSQAEGS